MLIQSWQVLLSAAAFFVAAFTNIHHNTVHEGIFNKNFNGTSSDLNERSISKLAEGVLFPILNGSALQGLDKLLVDPVVKRLLATNVPDSEINSVPAQTTNSSFVKRTYAPQGVGRDKATDSAKYATRSRVPRKQPTVNGLDNLFTAVACKIEKRVLRHLRLSTEQRRLNSMARLYQPIQREVSSKLKADFQGGNMDATEITHLFSSTSARFAPLIEACLLVSLSTYNLRLEISKEQEALSKLSESVSDAVSRVSSSVPAYRMQILTRAIHPTPNTVLITLYCDILAL